jgi:uncharacterized protein YwgA
MTEPGPREAAKIVETAGGRIVGRTRLQKVGCLLELAGARYGFKFTYHLFGPYSERLNIAASDAEALDLFDVEECVASWGGRYSIYKMTAHSADEIPSSLRTIAKTAADADSIELELAVTAAFLAANGVEAPWEEVVALKKSKATSDHLAHAKDLYKKLARDDLPVRLPAI